jgi:head-tail adaptor
MTAGQLRERVRFERRFQTADDGYGNTTSQWSFLGSMFARIDPGAGREDVLAAKLSGLQIWTITVRWSQLSKGLAPADRAVNERSGAIYNILSATNEDERHRYITMTCQSGGASG